MSSKAELCSMTWTEVRDTFQKNPVVLLPMGSIEEHGPQAPVGDYRYTTEVCRRIAEATGAVSAPTIPWGYSEYFKHFPGCLTLRPETLKAVLLDTLDGFLRHGLDHIVFVCGHKGNLAILEQVARQVKEELGIRLATIEPIAFLTPEFMAQVHGVEKVAPGHGSDPMGSLGMYLFPDEVRRDLIEPGNPPQFAGLPMKGMSNATFEGFPVHLYCDMEEVTPNGVLGDATLSSAKAGEAFVGRMVDVGTQFVRWFATQETRCGTKGSVMAD